jgi:hypothetical protein
MTLLNRQKVRCREINSADLAHVAKLLRIGYPDRKPQYWHNALATLSAHNSPSLLPKYGYVLKVHMACSSEPHTNSIHCSERRRLAAWQIPLAAHPPTNRLPLRPMPGSDWHGVGITALRARIACRAARRRASPPPKPNWAMAEPLRR